MNSQSQLQAPQHTHVHFAPSRAKVAMEINLTSSASDMVRSLHIEQLLFNYSLLRSWPTLLPCNTILPQCSISVPSSCRKQNEQRSLLSLRASETSEWLRARAGELPPRQLQQMAAPPRNLRRQTNSGLCSTTNSRVRTMTARSSFHLLTAKCSHFVRSRAAQLPRSQSSPCSNQGCS